MIVPVFLLLFLGMPQAPQSTAVDIVVTGRLTFSDKSPVQGRTVLILQAMDGGYVLPISAAGKICDPCPHGDTDSDGRFRIAPNSVAYPWWRQFTVVLAEAPEWRQLRVNGALAIVSTDDTNPKPEIDLAVLFKGPITVER